MGKMVGLTLSVILKDMKMIEQMQNILAFGVPGGWEWIIILIVAVLIFGRRLPEIARGVGKSLTEFKKGIKEAKDEVENDVDLTEEKGYKDDQDVVNPK